MPQAVRELVGEGRQLGFRSLLRRDHEDRPAAIGAAGLSGVTAFLRRAEQIAGLVVNRQCGLLMLTGHFAHSLRRGPAVHTSAFIPNYHLQSVLHP